MKWKIKTIIICIGLTICSSCSKENESTAVNDSSSTCVGELPNWSESLYALPYPVGSQYHVNQSNCSGFGHSGFWSFGYDFSMDIGTYVTASRSGTVGWATDGCPDGTGTCTNLVSIIHDDGTVAVYSHLTPGLFVESGEKVVVGDTIGRSGNTGYTGGYPHLHFSVHPCNDLPGLPNPGDCPTLPVNFNNTDPNPNGLLWNKFYKAL